MGRHLKFFNAHPYMASYALGVSIKLEEAFAAGDSDASEKLERVKELLVSILGAVGDKLFWLTLKPFSLIIGISFLFLLNSIPLEIMALFGIFLLYNIPHIYLRYQGIIEGYNYGLEIYKSFSRPRFKLLRKIYLWMGVFAFLLFFGFLIAKLSTENYLYLWAVGGAIFSTVAFYHYTRNFYLTVTLTLLLSIIAGFILN